MVVKIKWILNEYIIYFKEFFKSEKKIIAEIKSLILGLMNSQFENKLSVLMCVELYFLDMTAEQLYIRML